MKRREFIALFRVPRPLAARGLSLYRNFPQPPRLARQMPERPA
jgi:hypothetical protein